MNSEQWFGRLLSCDELVDPTLFGCRDVQRVSCGQPIGLCFGFRILNEFRRRLDNRDGRTKVILVELFLGKLSVEM